MTRLYRALIWLAVVALVVVLANAAIHTFPLFQSSNGIGYGTAGFVGSLADWLELLGIPAFFEAANTLVAGVIVLGIVVAWADHRRGWLIVVLLVTIATLLWPQAQQVWLLTHPSFPPPDNTVVTPSLSDMLTTFSVYAVSLVPILLLLVFALMRGRPAPGGEAVIAQSAL